MESNFNPFPGLRPFSAEEDYLFFGREEQTNELLSLLREHRFIAVVGTSGSGKSSLVRAGLLPALYGGTMVSVGSRWEVGVFRPGGDPIKNLAQSLIDCDIYDAEDPESLPRLMATLRRSRNGLVEAVRQSDLGEGHNLLLVVDQFEELFRFRADRPEHQELSAEFAQLLLHAAASPDIPIYITLTMRSDYLGECAQLPGLAEAVNHGEYLIPRLTRDQRRDAIERPVAVGGQKLTPRLINQLLNEVGDDVDQLPVLQHALMRIWDCWKNDHESGEAIDLRHYLAVGGLTKALSQHADEVYAELEDERSQVLCERIFKALTERGADERGIRRPTPMSLLCKIVDGEPHEVKPVLDAFRRVGRTFVMPLEETGIDEATIIDISHESLMRVWGRLRKWVDEESQSARVYRRLAETASLFNDQRAGFYRDPDLSIAWAWREKTCPNAAWAERYATGFQSAIDFLDKSQEAATREDREREQQRQRELEQARSLAEAQQKARRRSQGLTLCAVVATAVVGFLWHSASVARQEAVEQRERAEQEVQKNQMGLYAASIRQAERELASGSSRNAALDQLDHWKNATGIDGTADSPAMRDWEWYFLKGKARSTELDPRIETLKLGSRVNYAGRWSPDGKRLAVTGLGKQVLILDAETRDILQIFNRKGLEFSPRIAWSPDSESIAIDNWFGTVEIYDLKTGLLTQILNHNAGNTNSTLSWNHELNLIAYCLDQGKIGIYDMAKRQLVNVFSTSSEVQAIEWNPAGDQLAFSTTPGGLHIIDYPSMKVSYKLGTRFVQRLRWTPDGKQLICQDARPSQLFVVTPATNEHTTAVESGVGGIWGMAMHPHEPWVALSGPRGEIGIFDYRQLALVDSIKGFPGMMVGVDWRPQGDLLFVSGFTQGSTMLVDLSKRRQSVMETDVNLGKEEVLGEVLDCKLGPDGKRVALSTDIPGRLQLAAPGKRQETKNIDTALNDIVYTFDWSPEGDLLAVAGDQTLLVVDSAKPEIIRASHSLEDIGRLSSLEWSTCGKYLAFTQGMNAKSEWGVLKYEDPSLQLLKLEEVDSIPQAIAWHPQRPTLALGLRQNSRRGGPIELWDVAAGSLEQTIQTLDTDVRGLAFSNAGDRLAAIFARPSGLFSFESSGAIEIFSAESGTSLVQFPAQSVNLMDINWSVTDQRLVTSSFDGNVRVWRSDGTELLTLNPFESAPVRFAFWDEAGGSLMASALQNTQISTWTIEDSLDDASVTGSPVLLGNLLASSDEHPQKAASIHASSGNFEAAGRLFRRASLKTADTTIFSTNYWRVVNLPEAVKSIASGDLTTLDAAELKDEIEPIRGQLWDDPNAILEKLEYVGRDGSRLNLSRTSEDLSEKFQVIATRYFATRPTHVALVMGGGENILVWHDDELAIDHRQPGLVGNGEIGTVVELKEGWNDFLFVVYSESKQLELQPFVLDKPERIIANSLATWDGVTAGSFELAANELELSSPAQRTIDAQLDELAGRFDSSVSALQQLEGRAHTKYFAHSLKLGERGDFEQATALADRIHDDLSVPYTEFLYGECLARTGGTSLVSSESAWDLFVPDGPGGDQVVGELLEAPLDPRFGLWHRKLPNGSLTHWVGYGGFPRTLPNRGSRHTALIQTSFSNETALESLLLEVETPDGLVVYLDGKECYRANIIGPDKFNKRGQKSSFHHDANYSRRIIPLPMPLAAGAHRISISFHLDASWNQLWFRCPTLTGFPEKPDMKPEGLSQNVELAFHLANAAYRGHFDHERVDELINAGIDGLFVEDVSRYIYAILESSKTLDESERQALGKLLTLATLPARSFNIAIAVAPTLRSGDEQAMHDLLAQWQRSTPNDSRLLAAKLLRQKQTGSEPYEAARSKLLAGNQLDLLNSHQQLLICCMALTKMPQEQLDRIDQWKSEWSLWDSRSKDSALKDVTDGLLELQNGALDAGIAKRLEKLEQTDIQPPVDRLLASALLSHAGTDSQAMDGAERSELQAELKTMLRTRMNEHSSIPFPLEDWIKYKIATGILAGSR